VFDGLRPGGDAADAARVLYFGREADGPRSRDERLRARHPAPGSQTAGITALNRCEWAKICEMQNSEFSGADRDRSRAGPA
jgi:hypothetical protein